jgi:hypothetical protein
MYQPKEEEGFYNNHITKSFIWKYEQGVSLKKNGYVPVDFEELLNDNYYYSIILYYQRARAFNLGETQTLINNMIEALDFIKSELDKKDK